MQKVWHVFLENALFAVGTSQAAIAAATCFFVACIVAVTAYDAWRYGPNRRTGRHMPRAMREPMFIITVAVLLCIWLYVVVLVLAERLFGW